MVARRQVWNVHPLGTLQRPGQTRMGNGERRHSGRRIRTTRKALQSKAERSTRLGEAGKACGSEVYGDDNKAPRRLLSLRYKDDQLLRTETSGGARYRERGRRSR